MGYIEQFRESVTKVIKVGQENVTVTSQNSNSLDCVGELAVKKVLLKLLVTRANNTVDFKNQDFNGAIFWRVAW